MKRFGYAGAIFELEKAEQAVALFGDDHNQAHAVPTLLTSFVRRVISERHDADALRLEVKVLQQILANLEGALARPQILLVGTATGGVSLDDNWIVRQVASLNG